jgi:hypothetical protein
VTRIRDYSPWLEQAIAEAKASGLEPEANELERAAFAVFTTSSEVYHEQGLAIRRFLAATRGRLPRATQAKLDACLIEIDLVWPGWRKLWALLRRKPEPR